MELSSDGEAEESSWEMEEEEDGSSEEMVDDYGASSSEEEEVGTSCPQLHTEYLMLVAERIPRAWGGRMALVAVGGEVVENFPLFPSQERFKV